MCRKFIASFLPFLVAACASLQKRPTVNVPDKLNTRANESLAMIVSAKGVQIYDCRAKQNLPGAYEWVFVAPEADLFDTNRKQTLCRSTLGSNRRWQGRGYSERTCRRATS